MKRTVIAIGFALVSWVAFSQDVMSWSELKYNVLSQPTEGRRIGDVYLKDAFPISEYSTYRSSIECKYRMSIPEDGTVQVMFYGPLGDSGMIFRVFYLGEDVSTGDINKYSILNYVERTKVLYERLFPTGLYTENPGFFIIEQTYGRENWLKAKCGLEYGKSYGNYRDSRTGQLILASIWGVEGGSVEAVPGVYE